MNSLSGPSNSAWGSLKLSELIAARPSENEEYGSISLCGRDGVRGAERLRQWLDQRYNMDWRNCTMVQVRVASSDAWHSDLAY
jgi:hypothetical protein